MAQHNVMPHQGKNIRNALYSDGAPFPPSLVEKDAAYRRVLQALPEVGAWYDWHRHLSWCSGREKKIREGAAHAAQDDQDNAQALLAVVDAHVHDKMLVNPDPSVSVVAQWARELELPIMLVFAAVVSLSGHLE
ncbi:hypothetical protein C8Q74DRAFT_1235253 [Fomes fomentarius]|nr:hypothetical protein C8Q74DRAFT_1235253 [Fomes fomentarius]